MPVGTIGRLGPQGLGVSRGRRTPALAAKRGPYRRRRLWDPTAAIAVNNFILTLGGSITPTGALSTSLAMSLFFAGSITPTGALALVVGYVRSFSGSISPTGAFSRVVAYFRSFGGNISPSGALASSLGYFRSFAGAITPGGALSALAGRLAAFAGSITPSAVLGLVYAVGVAPVATYRRVAAWLRRRGLR